MKNKIKHITPFGAPKCAEERQMWSDILGCKITETAYVCEEHFNPEFIKSKVIVYDSNGDVLYSVSRQDFFRIEG